MKYYWLQSSCSLAVPALYLTSAILYFFLHGLPVFQSYPPPSLQGYCGDTLTPFLQQGKAVSFPLSCRHWYFSLKCDWQGEACGSQGRGHGEQPTPRHPGVVWGNGQHLKGCELEQGDMGRCSWNHTGRLIEKLEQEGEEKGRRLSAGRVWWGDPGGQMDQGDWDWC